MRRICIVPEVKGIGGMASFRGKFEAGLRRRGIEITHNVNEQCDAVLVIAGTRNLHGLWKARRRGLRVVQRLDGLNWVHRRRKTGARHFLRAEYGNLILSFIRRRLADGIVYQSQFARQWWEDWYGTPRSLVAVVHNGVDLQAYSPQGPGIQPADRQRLLVVEGSLGGGYDMGLENAMQLASLLNSEHGFPMELMVVGRISDSHRADVQARASVSLLWAGVVPQDLIPEIDRSAHLLFSADLHPACPNAVIEAMACGLPVVAFDTGAVRELVPESCGRVVPYGGDPWRMDPPDVRGLAIAAAEVLRQREAMGRAARAHAEQALGLDQMVEGYLRALLEA
jgi:glycosyltransferase involved in cell wall biosynthesis